MTAAKIQALFFIFTLAFSTVLAQSHEEQGYPYVVNYSQADFHASSMNYSVARDSVGLFYVANEDGVLVFDGHQWELVPIIDNRPIYWVEVGQDQVVYVASSSEFGYLSTDGGRLKYVSLLDQIDKKYHDFEVVWEVAKTSQSVIFRSKKYLFVKTGNHLKTIPAKEKGFDVAYSVDDTIYVRERGVGLCRLVEDKVELLPGGEFFADIKLNIFLPYPDDRMLVGSRSKGLFIYDRGSVSALQTEADSIFYNFNIYHGCILGDGNYALASSNAGIAIIDRYGKLLQFMDYRMGLPNNQMLSVAALDQSNLWLGTGRGVSKVRYNSPLSYYDYKLGLKDMVTDVRRFNDKIYISTLFGLYELGPNQLGGSRAKQINHRSLQEVLSLDELDNKLLIGSQDGLLSHENGQFKNLVARKETRKIKVSEDQHRIYASIGEGHFGIYYKTSEGFKLTVLDDFIEPVKKIIEFGDHVVLITGYGNLVILKYYYEDQGLRLEKKHFYQLDNFNATKYRNELIVFTPQESFNISMDGRISSKRKHFFSESIHRIDEVESTADDHMWLCFENEQRINYCEQVFLQEDTIRSCKYKFKTDFRINTILAEDQGISWFGGSGGLLRYDANLVLKNKSGQFRCYINDAIYQENSVLFRLAHPDTLFTFEEENVALRFSCFTNQVSRPGETLYQFKLDGGTEGWTNWTADPIKIYTHLSHGKYVFKARAKNYANEISSEAEFEFSIKPPFYQSVYAYILYGVSLIICIYALVIWRLYAAKSANRKLEAKVRARTQEVEDQKEVLKQSNKTKDQLFSIIGHDLRSPLNSLQSLTELIQHYRKEKNKAKVDEMMGAMTLSVKNLRNLLDNLLTWTLSQSGRFNLRSSAIEIRPLFMEIMSVLQDAATNKNITIEQSVEVSATFIGDKNSLSVIVRNLLSNAIKFTEQGGKITLKVRSTLAGIEFEIEDTGVGIPKKKLNQIYELSHSSYGTSMEKGTGLGLTLVRDFVELNKGTIAAESQIGKGTKFSVFIPTMEE